MTLGMMAFWVLLIAAVVWLVRGLDQRPAGSRSSQLRGPEQLLAERFARGDIDECEFNDRRARTARRPASGDAAMTVTAPPSRRPDQRSTSG
jgi:putative membrane protein